MALIAEWRAKGGIEAILIVDDEDNTVREAWPPIQRCYPIF